MSEKQNLNQTTLSKLDDDILVPTYKRSNIFVGIYHFGVGGFHRAHQALAMDNLFAQGLARDYGICGVGVLDIDAKMRDVMQQQNCLYTLVEKYPNGKFSYRVIGSVVDYIYAPDNVSNIIEKLASSNCKIVSLTITEGGYNINPDGSFDLQKVKRDIKNITQPKTVFGIVVEALRRRRIRGLKGFTIMSCDNLQENGLMAKKAFISFASAIDKTLAKWIESNVSFPSTMVDRITPVTTPKDREMVAEKLGVVDEWPVVCEDFFQWVIEDKFVAGRPPFEKANAQMVKDVKPYELMKLRLINAGHQAIAYFGLLLNYTFVHDVAQNALIINFLKSYMDQEATSTLEELEGVDVTEYKKKIVERFQNPNVLDTLARLAVDGSDRIYKFVFPVIHDRLKKNESIWFSCAIVASFAHYLKGENGNGEKIEIVDCAKEKLLDMKSRLDKDSTLIREESEIFGNVVSDERFVKVFKQLFDMIDQEGPESALRWLASID